MWAKKKGSFVLRSEDASAAAPPFPKGCGRLTLARRGNRGRINTRGDPGYGRPVQYVTKNEPRRLSSWFVFAIRPPIPQSTLIYQPHRVPTAHIATRRPDYDPTTRRHNANDAGLKPNNEGRTPNDEHPTTNTQRRTPNDERRTPNDEGSDPNDEG